MYFKGANGDKLRVCVRDQVRDSAALSCRVEAQRADAVCSKYSVWCVSVAVEMESKGHLGAFGDRIHGVCCLTRWKG